MQEALDLQLQWEQALAQICKGRSYDQLTLEEQQEWDRLGVFYNEQIDKKLADSGLL